MEIPPSNFSNANLCNGHFAFDFVGVDNNFADANFANSTIGIAFVMRRRNRGWWC